MNSWPVATVTLVDHEAESEANAGRTNVFVQWKGTDACLDLHCDCGYVGHFDGEFAYQLECPRCGAIWVMPSTIYPVKVDAPLPSAVVKRDNPGWEARSFVCPRCGMESFHPKDIEYGYCGNCHAFIGPTKIPGEDLSNPGLPK